MSDLDPTLLPITGRLHDVVGPGWRIRTIKRTYCGVKAGTAGYTIQKTRRRVWTVGWMHASGWTDADPAQAHTLAIDLNDKPNRAMLAWWLRDKAPTVRLPDDVESDAWFSAFYRAAAGLAMTREAIATFGRVVTVVANAPEPSNV